MKKDEHLIFEQYKNINESPILGYPIGRNGHSMIGRKSLDDAMPMFDEEPEGEDPSIQSYDDLHGELKDVLGSEDDGPKVGDDVVVGSGTRLNVTAVAGDKVRGIVPETGAEHTINRSDVVQTIPQGQ